MTSPRSILLSLALLLPGAARAEEVVASTFDAHGFNLAAFTDDPRGGLAVQSPGRFEAWDVFLGGVLEYADQPLVRVDGDGARSPLLDDVVALNLSLGLALTGWLRLDAALPLYFHSVGDGGAPQGFQLGDTRLAAMIELARPRVGDNPGLGFGVVPFVDLPSGGEAAFLGQSAVDGGAKLALAWQGERVNLGVDGGVQFNPDVELGNLRGGEQLLVGALLGYNFDPTLTLTAEGTLRAPFVANEVPFAETPAEVLLSLRKRARGGLHVLVGGALGVSPGATAANYRVFVGGGFGTLKDGGPRDRDQDGLIDTVDQCPDQPETANGIHDDDGCPELPATLGVTVTRDGQIVPGASIDLSGGAAPMHTVSAAAPWVIQVEPGQTWSARATLGGCLVGTGSATTTEGRTDVQVPLEPEYSAAVAAVVVDPQGRMLPEATLSWSSPDPACSPSEASRAGTKVAMGVGEHTATARADGYRPATARVTLGQGEIRTITLTLQPTQVRVTEQQIVILAPVYFDYDKDTIKPESFPILDDVALTMKEHPEMLSVEVAGHTDADGADAYNQELSQRRVESVRVYLMDKGVDGGRLVAKGYGESRPIAPNTDDAGKAKNRRVEFNIVQRADTAPKAP